MLEKYYKYKIKFNNYILLIKFGSFYEVFNEDSIIISKLFHYKIKRISDGIKSGFPSLNLDNVINKLNILNINYIVVLDDEVIDKKEFANNNYSLDNVCVSLVKFNLLRIEKITKCLNDKILDNNFNDLLSNIEGMLDCKIK